MARINASTRTYANQKVLVARAVGMHDRDTEIDAESAIHLALDWMQEYDWNQYLFKVTFNTVAGTADYTFISGGTAAFTSFKKMYSVRVTSANERSLTYIPSDLYDRQVQDQSSNGLFTHYSLPFAQGTGGGAGIDARITLLPTPDAVETVELIAYTYTTMPSVDGSAIDMPLSWDRPVVLYAQALAGMWRGLRTERVNQLFQLATEARTGAFRQDQELYDHDLRFIPMAEHMGPRWPWDHPLAGAGDYE